MLFTYIEKNSYHDSINLMLLSNHLNELDGVIKGQAMMATEANKTIFEGAGLYSDELTQASPNDLAILVESDNQEIMSTILEEVENFLDDLSIDNNQDSNQQVDNWEDALKVLPDANLALISIPGEYAPYEIDKALDKGLHVFCFSDNIPVETEARLKEKAHEKGLLLMGADCGTGLISSVPLAFTNIVRPGNIGIVGASGTGIQEVSSIIDRLGGGVSHAIGTGGRDLKEAIGARTMLEAITALEDHVLTDVICVISKPPAPAVRDKVMQTLQSLSKPVVAIFLGEEPDAHVGNVSVAYTLEETAQIAVDLAKGAELKTSYRQELKNDVSDSSMKGKKIQGLYSGGTLATEAAMLISEALELPDTPATYGYLLQAQGHEVMDLGDDMYTQGKPHPMIDPSVRIEKLHQAIENESTGVILFDLVLGYGASQSMAETLLKEITAAKEKSGEKIEFVASVVGTDGDPQNYGSVIQSYQEAGVLIEESNERAVRLALKLLDFNIADKEKERVDDVTAEVELAPVSSRIEDLLNSAPRVINIGLSSFFDPIVKHGGQAVQFNWRPLAGGNKKLIHILNELDGIDELEASNQVVINRMKEAQPILKDVQYAKDLIPQMANGNKVILHAGPEIEFERMSGPMQGSCIGAVLFEGWADSQEAALELLATGGVEFIPCHHVGAVGPMGGITSPHFPMLVVENELDGTTGYCIMNEGIGEVLRFGANSPAVIQRLEWQRDVLGPILGEALRTMENGLNVSVMISKAITMGDEFHQRNIAASLVFLKEISPAILRLDIDEEDRREVIEFLAKTDQFFLNIAMAAGKCITDYARKHQKGCIVTAMARNGENYGIRIAGLGDQWFTAPVNTPKGLYFTGYDESMANPDIGDSAITETIGLGGSAMVAAPGVTRFIGAGGFEDAVRISNEQNKIVTDRNPAWTIPTWNFQGTNLGIDIRKVVETGVVPIINTGIAHKEAGIGQIGAGTVDAPLAAFEKALIAYAESLGIESHG